MGKTSFFILLLLLSQSSVAWAADAARVEKVIAELEHGARRGMEFEIRERDLNAFLRRQMELERASAVDEIHVTLLNGSFRSDMTVDLDQVEIEDPSLTSNLFLSLFKGRQKLRLEGKLSVRNGTGTYHTENAWLNGMPLPAAVVDSLIRILGKKQDPPFDPTRPFPMPFGIQSIRFEPGLAIIRN